MSIHIPRILMVTLLAAVAGCDLFTEVDCPAILSPAIRIEVRDATTDAPMALDASGTVTSGDHVEEMEHGGELSLVAYGVQDQGLLRFYDVTVTAPGYETSRREGVPVMAGECGVRTTGIEVRMIP